jgi:hypothetical protein
MYKFRAIRYETKDVFKLSGRTVEDPRYEKTFILIPKDLESPFGTKLTNWVYVCVFNCVHT